MGFIVYYASSGADEEEVEAVVKAEEEIERWRIFPPYLSGVVGKSNSLQTNIICIGGSPYHMERLVFDGDCEEDFYEWVENNGLVTMRKNGDVFFTDDPSPYEKDA